MVMESLYYGNGKSILWEWKVFIIVMESLYYGNGKSILW